ncbi:MAG: rod shape-determining protein MreC [Bacteroidetes bacterium]|nr:rod shape-determining protein MreC [Bacteroidota bacterium]
MLNLIRFIWKYSSFFLFLILESICFYLIFQNSFYQKAQFISSSNSIAGNVFTTVNSTREYFNLKETNEMLARENAILHTASKAAFVRTKTTETTVNDTLLKQQYIFVNARVVNNSVNKRNNYLTLNIGSNRGIKPEMAVISSNGIVGITKAVSENFTSVLSVLNKDAKISAKIKKNNYFGSLSWEVGDYKLGTLTDIPTHVKILKGDTIVTNAFSAIFPENIMIGFIESYEIKPGDNFYTISVRFSTNFKNVAHVFVVKNLMKEEQNKLEQETQNDK